MANLPLMMPLTSGEKRILEMALDQDSGNGDLTACIFKGETGKASIIAEEDCVLSGLEAMEYLFESAGCSVMLSDGALPGSICGKGARLATVEGPVEGMFRAERIALNVLSRMSGIATEAMRASDMVEKVSPGTRVAGTRKTTPVFGPLEKRALIDGGALPHRPDLSSLAMLKDNHIAALGGGPDAVRIGLEILKKRFGPYVKVEVEVEDIPTGLAALESGAEVIMLDNFDPNRLEEASLAIRKAAGELGREITLEASGGIELGNLELYAPHVDVISMGALTCGSHAVGFRMDYMDRN